MFTQMLIFTQIRISTIFTGHFSVNKFFTKEHYPWALSPFNTLCAENLSCIEDNTIL